MSGSEAHDALTRDAMTQPAPSALPAPVSARVTRRLALENPAAVEAFEQAFYEAFAHATHNRLVQWLWDWNHTTRRLRTRVPYADQQVWVTQDGAGAVTDAVAVNTTLRLLQSAVYGFAIPADLAEAGRAGRICEFLTLFAVGDHALGTKRALWRELFDDLRASGYTHALGTTSPKIYPIYRWMGAQKIGEAQIENEIRYFLRFDLSRTKRQ